MQKTAKIFMNNRSQAVRLPKEFRFSTPEVYIRKQGDEVILSPRPADWSEYIAAGTITSGPDDFMELIDDLPVQERAGAGQAANSGRAQCLHLRYHEVRTAIRR